MASRKEQREQRRREHEEAERRAEHDPADQFTTIWGRVEFGRLREQSPIAQ